jgi:hypothetical protein
VLSRYIVIALAFGLAVYRAAQGAWVESTGLVGLGAGLVMLRVSATRPSLRPLAYLGFLITALSLATSLLRLYLART